MSEYWVSKKKYFCKYCEIYITDDGPSRQQHENGLRHKGNRDRFIRGLYKEGEKRKKDAEEEKREMVRVERAAQAAFSQDVGAGRARPTLVPSSSSSTAQKPATKPSDPYANYTTAASLGYADPDLERAAAEAAHHNEQGVAGDWQIVVPSEQPQQTVSEEATHDATKTPSSNANLKRPAETPVDQEDTRYFKLQKKTLGTGLGQIYDPGIIALKPKKKEPIETKEEIQQEKRPAEILAPKLAEEPPKATDAPKWTKLQWKRPGEKEDEVKESEQISEAIQDQDQTDIVKKEVNDSPPLSTVEAKAQLESVVKVDPDDLVESEPVEAAVLSRSSGLFKKRRKPAGTNTGRIQV
ncbi:formin binding [Moniliophthora roreri MCA 2997]|uniref:Formin binding n=2 Tax=Moniliophthora roreri TaxID=221103 RepID=V2XSE2_MONRO|nr:formin binding [Moniliophthora roreri MCA 2997]KAI3618787.1 formin binding [Moniliophthora roreri]